MTRKEFRQAVQRRLAAVEDEYVAQQAASDDCSHCGWDCQCDGDWSPAAEMARLDKEKEALRALLA